MAEVAAYLRLCMQGQLPFMLIILGIDIGYLWIKLAVHVVATAFPKCEAVCQAAALPCPDTSLGSPQPQRTLGSKVAAVFPLPF